MDDLAGARRLTISALFFCLACSGPPQQLHPVPELTTHLGDSENKAEHDEIQIAGGLIVEEYPNRNSPRRIYYRFPQGGIIDQTCSDMTTCREWTMKITGFKPGHMPGGFSVFLPEGIYLFVFTDDPHLQLIKNPDTDATVAYWVRNRDYVWVTGSYKQAMAMKDPR